MIRVLVVEDSAVQREFLRFLIEQGGDFTVVGTTRNGANSVRDVERLRPDIVLMDYHMPETDGLEATRQIMQRCPTPIVIASASLVPDDVQSTFDAIKYGALAVIAKPPAVGSPGHDRLARELLRTLRLMADIKVVRRRSQREAQMPPAAKPKLESFLPARVVALAGSTGAPAIIADILAAIRGDLPVPILVVQHLSEGFVDGFVRWLHGTAALPVEVARHGVVAQPGHIYVAPDGAQMGITASSRIALCETAPEDGFRPSATHLFRSVAKAFGARSLGILLSGMGHDGGAGLHEIRLAGGITAVQDEASCVVFGMPREAIRRGAVAHILPPARIAGLIDSCQSVIMERENVRSSQLGLV